MAIPNGSLPVIPQDKISGTSTPRTTQDVELDHVANGVPGPSLALEDDIMQCARLGEIGLIQKLFESGKYTAKYKDEEHITPLHWAAINNQYATCTFLVEAGADVNAQGGESHATPAMWAAQRCHYYVVNYLLENGTDPLIVDSAGYNILHLATIDGNSFLLVLLLHQDIPVDVPDSQGHTSLMWAAYKGFPACVDLLLRWGANVNAVDEKGLQPLHWALVKGSQGCVQKIIEFGADRFAATNDGKTPADVAEELRTKHIWRKALLEQSYGPDAQPKQFGFGLSSVVRNRNIMSKFYFIYPFLILWVTITILAKMPVYAAVPISFIISFSLQWLASQVALWGPHDYRNLHKTPFLAGVFAGTLFFVGFRWMTHILPETYSTHFFLNLLFATTLSLTTYFFSISALSDPGTVPRLPSRNQQRTVIKELFSLWSFNEDHFCTICMIRKPLRSKHCRRCNRCIAKQDHHCPWVNNCVGANNLRHFFLYIFSMFFGILLFLRLFIYYLETQQSETPRSYTCNLVGRGPACDIIMRDTWSFILAIWAGLQLIWVTMLVIVQSVQISKNTTTYENMNKHSHVDAYGHNAGRKLPPGQRHPDAPGAAPPSARHPRRHPDSCFTRWKKLLGVDAFLVTAKLVDPEAKMKSKRNPFSRGMVTNCKDFWCDGSSIFGKRKNGEARLDGENVNYTRLYEVPLRKRGGDGMSYESVNTGDGEEEV